MNTNSAEFISAHITSSVAVLRVAWKFFHARGKKDFDGARIEFAEQSDDLDGLGNGSSTQRAAEVLHTFFAEIGGEIGDVFSVIAQRAAIEARGELLHRGLREHF